MNKLRIHRWIVGNVVIASLVGDEDNDADEIDRMRSYVLTFCVNGGGLGFRYEVQDFPMADNVLIRMGR